MAPVVKWLRPRIVVPICMGSNPIRRPIIFFDMCNKKIYNEPQLTNMNLKSKGLSLKDVMKPKVISNSNKTVI